MDFAVSADHGVKIEIKESEKIDKSLDLTGELKRLWNIGMTVIQLYFGSLKGLEKRLLEVMKNRDHPDHSTKIGKDT